MTNENAIIVLKVWMREAAENGDSVRYGMMMRDLAVLVSEDLVPVFEISIQ